MIVSSSFTAKSIVYQPKIPLWIQDGKASPLSDYICRRRLDEGEGVEWCFHGKAFLMLFIEQL